MPTIVHTLVSPMSTCHSAPDAAACSLPVDPCRLDDAAEPAEFWRRRPFAECVFTTPPPVLDVERFPRFTRPPSFDGKSDGSGDVGALLPFAPEPK